MARPIPPPWRILHRRSIQETLLTDGWIARSFQEQDHHTLKGLLVQNPSLHPTAVLRDCQPILRCAPRKHDPHPARDRQSDLLPWLKRLALMPEIVLALPGVANDALARAAMGENIGG